MKKLIVSILMFVLTLTLFVVTVMAYFTDRKQTGEVNMTLGEINYQLSGSFYSGYLMPGVDLIENDFVLTNLSTIDTELRVSITVISPVFGTLSMDEMLGSSYYQIGGGFIFDETDDYYYYRGEEATLENDNYVIPPSSSSVILLSYLELDGYKFSNNHANMPLNFTITFEAKQGHFVDWETLGTVTYTVTP
ncbi:MAG: hypothetical protein RBQ91_07185 [Acholeplasma sp.]|nr:hypothetical protein [Acholeplasma sp.]